jgi:hypothetical protein
VLERPPCEGRVTPVRERDLRLRRCGKAIHHDRHLSGR